MTNDYIDKLLNKLDQEFVLLFGKQEQAEIFPFPGEPEPVVRTEPAKEEPRITELKTPASKLDRIITLAAKISAERYGVNYNPEICLANLLNVILTDGKDYNEDNFFELLNEERNVELPEALTDFEFYKNNPYKRKAERILSKIEARKNR